LTAAATCWTSRQKVVAQFGSKKDPKLNWSGRGQGPLWMKAEIKGIKLK
jgi:hypothetical protein